MSLTEKERHTFAELQERIRCEIAGQPHLQAHRAHNRAILGELAKCHPVKGSTLLDLGASIHGYALEAALEHGVALYEGIGLDIRRHWDTTTVEFVSSDGRIGRLRQMNADQLEFSDESFDCLLTISTFEHFLRPAAVLDEMFRVLRHGGVALVTFEPVWTSPGGHHLHHFASLNELVPPWSHLFLSETQMHDLLARNPWPADAPIDLSQALRWIYQDSGINRLSIRELQAVFERAPFEVVWSQPLRRDVPPDEAAVARYLTRILPYTADDLLTIGLSLLLRKN